MLVVRTEDTINGIHFCSSNAREYFSLMPQTTNSCLHLVRAQNPEFSVPEKYEIKSKQYLFPGAVLEKNNLSLHFRFDFAI